VPVRAEARCQHPSIYLPRNFESALIFQVTSYHRSHDEAEKAWITVDGQRIQTASWYHHGCRTGTGKQMETVTIAIGKAEALVLFELLADFNDEPTLAIRDNADRLALVRLGGILEKTLVEPFMQNYNEIISEARNQLTKDWGDR
jgi:hypothetical protein